MCNRARNIYRLFTATALVIAIAAFAYGATWKARLVIPLPAEPTALAYSADATLIAIGHSDGRVTVWDTKSGNLVGSLNAHKEAVKTIKFTRRGDKVITLGKEGQARVWLVSDSSQAAQLEDAAFSLAISQDGRSLAAQDAQQALWLWDLSTVKRVKQLGKAGVGGGRDLTFTPDDQHIVIVFGNEPHMINVMTGEDTKIPVRTSMPQINVEKTGKDQVAISLGSLDDNNAMSHNLALSPGGALVAVGRGWYGKPAFVDVVDLSTMKLIRRYKPKDAGTQSSFSFDNSLLAIEGEKTVTLWNVATGKQVGAAKGSGMVSFSPKLLELAVTDDKTLTIYAPG